MRGGAVGAVFEEAAGRFEARYGPEGGGQGGEGGEAVAADAGEERVRGEAVVPVFCAGGFGGVEQGAGALVLTEEEAVGEEDFAFVGREVVVWGLEVGGGWG